MDAASALVAAGSCSRGGGDRRAGCHLAHRGGPGRWRGARFTFLAGIPAFTTSRSFGRVCLAFAVALFAVGVLGALLALFVYLPVAVMLLLAWLADPGARPRLAPLIAVTDAAVFVLMATVLGAAILS